MKIKKHLLLASLCLSLACDRNQESSDNPDTQTPTTSNQDNEAELATADIKTIGSLAIDEENIAIVAKSLDGKVKFAEVDEQGQFEIPMDQDSNYTIAIVTGSLAISNPESALALATNSKNETFPLKVKNSGLESLPTQLVDSDEQVTLDLGEITANTSSSSSENLENSKAFKALNISEQEAQFVGANDDNAGANSIFDVNGNGVLDHTEDLYVSISLAVQWRDDETGAFSVDSMKGQFLDFDSFLTKQYQSYSFITFKIAEAFAKSKATMTFPEIKICGTDSDQTCNTTATSKEVSAGEYSDIVPDGGNGTKATQYSITLKSYVNGNANPFLEGTYKLQLEGGETISVPNFKPRNINEESSLTYPQIKINESAGSFASIDYKWKTKDSGSATFRDSTLNELELLFKGAGSSKANAGMQIAGVNEAIGCTIPITALSGTIKLEDCFVKDGTNLPVSWSDLDVVNVSTRDAFEFQSGYFLVGPNFN